MKKACGSSVRYPNDHSKKLCICGAHSRKAKKPRGKKHRATKPSRDSF